MIFELPEIPPSITKEYLLSRNSEETYMSTYLGVPVKKGLIVSPLRNDHRPTASFYRNKKGDLIFHDFGTGFHGNFIGVVMYLNSCSYRKAMSIIAEDFGYIKKHTERAPIKIKTSIETIKEKAETLIQVEPQPFSLLELNWWESYGITQSTLNKFRIVSCKSVFLNGHYMTSSSETNPIYGYYFGKRNNTELWKIYFPKKKVYRFIGNTSSQLLQGSKQLPSSGDLLVITKSLKDCACLYELGIPAIAPNSEVLFISDYQLAKLKLRFKHILVFYDNDLTGIVNLNKIRRKHPDLLYFFIPRKYNAKDCSDFYKKYGEKKIKEGIEQIRKYYKI